MPDYLEILFPSILGRGLRGSIYCEKSKNYKGNAAPFSKALRK